MHWIIQEGFNDQGWLKLLETVERFGIPHSIHKVVPFEGRLIPEPQIDHKNVICVGSYSMRHAAKEYGWYPGVFDVGDTDFTIQKSHWGSEMLNFDSEIKKFRDIFLTQPTFIRPINDSKAFNGGVYQPEEWNDWVKKADSLADIDCQVSSVKEIWAEYRFFVVGEDIVTGSQYKRGGETYFSADIDRHIWAYALGVAGSDFCLFPSGNFDGKPKWRPAPAFTLDICETSDGMKIVEINTINSSGFYMADVPKLVFALESKFNEHRSRL